MSTYHWVIRVSHSHSGDSKVLAGASTRESGLHRSGTLRIVRTCVLATILTVEVLEDLLPFEAGQCSRSDGRRSIGRRATPDGDSYSADWRNSSERSGGGDASGVFGSVGTAAEVSSDVRQDLA